MRLPPLIWPGGVRRFHNKVGSSVVFFCSLLYKFVTAREKARNGLKSQGWKDSRYLNRELILNPLFD